MLNVSPDPPPCKALIPLTATQLPYVPHGAVGAARLRAGTAARLRVAAPYCALAAAAGYGDTTPYDKRPAELHNPRITQATYMSIWESAHLAGRRCRVGIGPPCRAPVLCGNPPILPGAAAVWESAHLAGRRCCVEIRPPCRALLSCGNRPTLPRAGAVWESALLAGRRCRVGIGPPCRAPLPCGNPPTLPGAAVVWESAHLAGCVIASDLTTHLHFTW
jgi:hypothetical protein